MELWFWAAVGATIFMGVGNFTFKLAAKRGYDGAAFSLYGAITTIPPIVMLAIVLSSYDLFSWLAFFLAALSGFFGAMNNVAKVIALRHIDTTIYFPLFKLLSPLFAIGMGVFLFAEQFSNTEWLGLMLGLAVPLLLLNKGEQSRQNNLYLGLVLILVTALLAASGAALFKYATALWPDLWGILLAQVIGLFVGSVIATAYRSVAELRQLLVFKVEKIMVFWAFLRSALMATAMLLISFAYINGGTLAVVHTITSMYILIPIVLAIIFYNEHWNLQKVVAIVLSVASLALLG